MSLTIYDLDPDLFIEALELLPGNEYSCHAITNALRLRDPVAGWETCRLCRGSEEHSVYAGLFAPMEGCIEPGNDGAEHRCYSWLINALLDEEKHAWRETALCFMAAIAADPWE